MRTTTSIIFVGTSILALACVAAEKTLTSHEHGGAPAANSKTNDITRVDFDGMADLVVDQQATQQHWVVREEKLPAEFCSVVEGGVTPGLRRLIRFTVTTPNIGDADVYVGNPQEHIDKDDGMFEFASCHAHYHFKNYARYRLIEKLPNGKDGKVWRTAKKGFCMLDTDPNPRSTYSKEPPAGDRNFYSCGTLTRPGFQGVSHGWADTYIFFLGGQYFVLDGGDGQEPVPPGDYYIEVTVNPSFPPTSEEPCKLAIDSKGQCHNFPESNYENNSMRAVVTIGTNSGKSSGPEKDSKILDYEPMKGPEQ
jgi:hypothetical protein